MKTIVDALTGELIEVEEPNDIAIRELNELDVNFEEYCDLYIKLKYFKDQVETWEYKNKPALIKVFDEAFKDSEKKTIKLENGSITYVKEGMTKKVDTDALKATTLESIVKYAEANPTLKDKSLYDLFLKLSPREASLRIKVNEVGE